MPWWAWVSIVWAFGALMFCVGWSVGIRVHEQGKAGRPYRR